MPNIPSPAEVIASGLALPGGVTAKPLTEHGDDRGAIAEIFRDTWDLGPRPVQWNLSLSGPNVFRGVHAHTRHVDYLVVTAGEAIVGLHDLRAGSATCGLSILMRLIGEELCLLKIPVGVAHGVFHPRPTTVMQAMTHEFDGTDDLCCRWDDPGLGLEWPCNNPILSRRDAAAGPLAKLREAFGLAEFV